MPQAKGRCDFSAPEIAFPAALAVRITKPKALSMLKRLGRCVSIGMRASTCGSSDMITSLTSSGNIATTLGSTCGSGAATDDGDATEERCVMGDDVWEPLERLRSSFSSATGLSWLAPGRPRTLRIEPAGVRDNRV
jgi:hypothetical protein